MAYLGLNDIDSTIGYHGHSGNAMTAYLKGMWTGQSDMLKQFVRIIFAEKNKKMNISSL